MPRFSNWLQPDKETTKMDKCVFVCECCSSLISHPGSSWIYIQKASHCLLFVSTACSFIRLKKPYLSHIHAYFLDLAEIPNTAAKAKVLWSPQSPVNSFMQISFLLWSVVLFDRWDSYDVSCHVLELQKCLLLFNRQGWKMELRAKNCSSSKSNILTACLKLFKAFTPSCQLSGVNLYIITRSALNTSSLS